jgi:flagellar hook-length control protein FliK
VRATASQQPEEAAPISRTAVRALATADLTVSSAPVAALQQNPPPTATPVRLADDGEAATGASAAKSGKSQRDQRASEVEHSGRKADPDPAVPSSPRVDKPATAHVGPEKSNPHSLSQPSDSQPTNTSPGGEARTPAAPASGASSAATPSPGVHSLESTPASSGASSAQAAISHGEPTPAAAAPMLVQSARVLERAGNSEMRVGLNTASFGNIELQTHVSQDHVAASITTGHAELRAAMVAEMPSLERAMSQHHLRLDNLDLNARAGGEDRGAGGDNPSRPQPGTRSSLGAYRNEERPEVKDNSPAPWRAPYSSGLNVHA